MLLSDADIQALAERLIRLGGIQIPPYLLGKQLDWTFTRVNENGNTRAQLVSANVNRVSLWVLSSVSSVQLTIAPAGIDSSQCGAAVLPSLPFYISTFTHGVLPQLAWEYTAGSGANSVLVGEQIWRQPQ